MQSTLNFFKNSKGNNDKSERIEKNNGNNSNKISLNKNNNIQKATKTSDNEVTLESIENEKKTLQKIILKKEGNDLQPITSSTYDPTQDCPWTGSSGVPFEFLCNAFEQVSLIKGAASKEKQKEIISRVLRTIIHHNPSLLQTTYYLCTLRLAPDYLDKELGIGDQILIKAISKVSGRTDKQVRESLASLGDLGKVAMLSLAQKGSMDVFFKGTKQPLSLQEVFDVLQKMSLTKGNHAEQEKQDSLLKLLFRAQPIEVQFLIRWIQGNLKISFAEASMQSALAKALYDHFNPSLQSRSKESLEIYEGRIKRAICEYPHQGHIISQLLQLGKDNSSIQELCHVRPGVPIKPMLAKPMKDIQTILHRFKDLRFTCEYKYDGLRGQIHYSSGKVDVYSRNLQNMNETYPDIISFIQNTFGDSQSSFVMDSEIVAIDLNTNRILPFQTLSSRSRKNVDIKDINVQVCIFMFDLLYYEGRSLLQHTLQQRRQVILDNFQEKENKLMYAIYKNTDDFDEIEDILNTSIKEGCEGLMIKTLDTNSTYEPAKRSFKWLKLKKDYLDGNLGDTFDLVPIGAFFGNGKRSGQYGSFLLACYNDDNELFQTTCKIGTGFSEEVLKTVYEELKETVVPQAEEEYDIKEFKCDVWFRATQVWEVKAADLQISPVYTSATSQTGTSKGIGMRFPRFLRFRDDKKVYDATTAEFIYDIYKQQSNVANNIKFNDNDDNY